MGKKKVILDTNILISALGWRGNPKKILDLIVEGKIEIFTSESQLRELSKVLDYPKFEFTGEQKDRLKSLILNISTIVKPVEKINVISKDPDDNMILECAVAGDVDYIVTGDPDLLILKEFRGIKIVKAKEFLDEF